MENEQRDVLSGNTLASRARVFPAFLLGWRYVSINYQLRSSSPEQTHQVAALLADRLEVGDTIVLLGDLGAGKTYFTKGLAQALGVTVGVTSPTFALANEYQGRLPLFHLDAYRLAGPDDAADLDLHEMAEQGITVIEWGHNIAALLPRDRLEITLEADTTNTPAAATTRTLHIEGFGPRSSELATGHQVAVIDRW